MIAWCSYNAQRAPSTTRRTSTIPSWKRSLSYRPSSSNAAREEHCFTTNGLAPVNHRATIRAGRGAYNLRGSGAGIDSLSRPVKRSGRRKLRERVSKLAQVPRFLEKKSPRDVSRDFFDEKVPRFFAKQCKEMDARWKFASPKTENLSS